MTATDSTVLGALELFLNNKINEADRQRDALSKASANKGFRLDSSWVSQTLRINAVAAPWERVLEASEYTEEDGADLLTFVMRERVAVTKRLLACSWGLSTDPIANEERRLEDEGMRRFLHETASFTAFVD